MSEDKLSHKMLLFEHYSKTDKLKYDANLVDEVMALEEENENLRNGKVDVDTKKKIEELEKMVAEKDRQIKTLENKLQEFENIKIELQHQKDMYQDTINGFNMKIRELLLKIDALEKRANGDSESIGKVKTGETITFTTTIPKDLKCYSCDSYDKGICKCNNRLGYDYCTKENGYKGYRKLIKEME